MSEGIVLHTLAALAYALLAGLMWRPLAGGNGTVKLNLVGRITLLGALLLHGAALYHSVLTATGLYLGWALAFSAAIWLGMIIFWLESLVVTLDGLLLILLPASTLATGLSALYPIGHLVPHANNELLRVHLIIALMAYGLVTVAALQAILMAALHRYLHRPIQQADNPTLVNNALDSMPPLLIQERLLFRLIWISFITLTLTLITGSLVSLQLVGRMLPFDHKTVFTLLSWFTFGGLLVGRHVRGWRGPLALRWTLTGFAFVMLAYTGSRFVIDVILHRG